MKTILLLTLILAATFAQANSFNHLKAQTTFTLNNPQYSWSLWPLAFSKART